MLWFLFDKIANTVQATYIYNLYFEIFLFRHIFKFPNFSINIFTIKKFLYYWHSILYWHAYDKALNIIQIKSHTICIIADIIFLHIKRNNQQNQIFMIDKSLCQLSQDDNATWFNRDVISSLLCNKLYIAHQAILSACTIDLSLSLFLSLSTPHYQSAFN